MTFWSGETLVSRGSNLVSDFRQEMVDCNAITLTVGEQTYRTADKADEKGVPPTVRYLEPKEWFQVPAGQFAYVVTAETVTVPPNAMGFISIKSKKKFEGLVNVSGFHVDPGYNNRLVFSVYNAGPSAVHLYHGMPLFLIWFADLDHDETDYRKPPDYGHKGIDDDIVKGMNEPVLSLQSLSKEISEVRQKMNVQNRVFGFGVVFGMLALIAIIGIAVRAIFFPPEIQYYPLPDSNIPSSKQSLN